MVESGKMTLFMMKLGYNRTNKDASYDKEISFTSLICKAKFVEWTSRHSWPKQSLTLAAIKIKFIKNISTSIEINVYI